MKFRIATLTALLALGFLPQTTAALPSPSQVPGFVGPFINRTHAVCDQPQLGQAGCQAKLYAQANGQVTPAALPKGLSPAQLRSAYGITADLAGKVAVVAAYDHPTIKADLDLYSQTFGLPVLPACTTAIQSSCFEKLDQRGGQRYPRRNAGWALEIALDVQAVHAICPSCRLELIEADSSSYTNMLAAVDRAVATGAGVVSMSWGGGESLSETIYDSHFQKAGTTFVAASGDSGYGTLWPAASPKVLATGGTTLQLASDDSRASETVWAGSGSGCSRYLAKPIWQHDTGCARRTIADVSAVADPATGAAVYTSYGPSGTGWFVVGGTSLSAPLIAGMIAMSGNTDHAAVLTQLYSSAGTSRLYDVTSGRNGTCATYLCKAGLGYDGPSGLGTPTGLTAF